MSSPTSDRVSQDQHGSASSSAANTSNALASQNGGGSVKSNKGSGVNSPVPVNLDRSEQPYGPHRSSSSSSIRPEVIRSGTPEGLRGRNPNGKDGGSTVGRKSSRSTSIFRRRSLSSQLPDNVDMFGKAEKVDMRSPITDISKKLGTFGGVFVPTTLNVLSILMFLRFGFILGQGGVLGTMVMLIIAYLINMVTTMSISAIATNGTVRGGGAYYLISRSLGAEFGGSIGIVLYIGFVLNTGMNAVGLIDCFTENFGSVSGGLANFLKEGFWWQYLWGTVVMLVCTSICLAGSSIFARASSGLLLVLLVATLSIPVSVLVKAPFSSDRLGIEFTGLSWETFMGNLKPNLTKHAAGSQIRGRETFRDLFGILFPATGGIFAGASMSGDLKDPSKSIPRGTLYGLFTTFFLYTVVILAIAATVTRSSLYEDVNIIQDVNMSAIVVLLGEFATSFFSSLMGIIGSAKLLQAIAKDTLVPGLSVFAHGPAKSGEPILAIFATFVIAQITMLFDINQIASFITMAYLMTFLVTNLACFLLKVGSAPNFRPSFHYFNSWTALAGTIVSGGTMIYVDGRYAAGCVCVLMLLFLLIHYTTPPKSWGDVSQSLIYHQVRKYLLRLRPEHVKFWRPQILLFVNDWDSQYKMIHFCNSLKKGALFVLGRVIVTDDFANTVSEIRREHASWTKLIEFSKIKAFMNVSVAPNAEWGIRNIVLSSGLGGMRPNIVVIGQYPKDGTDHITTGFSSNTRQRRGSHGAEQTAGRGRKRSDSRSADKGDSTMGVQSYVTILEDLLFKLRINVAVARGFENLELPSPKGCNKKTRIDLWPIQMSAAVSTDTFEDNDSLLTTNFDTYTLILQLGCILHTVPSWHKSYRIRVAVFVEYETDVEEERGRVETLLEKLRIEAEVLVFWLASGDLQSYRIIVNGDKAGISEDYVKRVDEALKDEDWWKEVEALRYAGTKPGDKVRRAGKLLKTVTTAWASPSAQEGQQQPGDDKRLERLRKIMESSKRRKSISTFGPMSVNFGMQTHRLLDSMVEYQSDDSEESSSEESDMAPYTSETEEDLDPTSEGSTSGDVSTGGSTTPRGPGAHRSKRKHRGKASNTESDTALLDESEDPDTDVSPSHRETPNITKNPASDDEEQAETKANLTKLRLPRVESSARFSSSPIPKTKVAQDETSGPSIMFADTSPPRSRTGQPAPRESIYRRPEQSTSAHPQRPGDRPDDGGGGSVGGPPASGYPSQASIPLSFNDLPCRAQHLILNELIQVNSDKTAVVFTTLPSPIEGTYQDKDASESFVSDLEVLCDGLPPCMLVHSNSMTVTMNL